jgi:DNA polymerase-3 subunit epsilon
MNSFVSFDVETTGFLPGVDQITEIGAIKFVNGSIDSIFATLINPKRSIPQVVTQVTGITDDMVKDQPSIDTVLEPLAEFCGSLPVVAHNANFDFQFLISDIKKFESSAPSGIVLDTCTMARKVIPGILNYKLSTLIQHLNIPSQGFHRAQADATYCGQLFLEILKRLSSNDGSILNEQLMMLSGTQKLIFPKLIKQPKQLDLLDALL